MGSKVVVVFFGKGALNNQMCGYCLDYKVNLLTLVQYTFHS